MTKKQLREYFSQMGKRGAEKMYGKCTPAERVEKARNAARKRWAKMRQVAEEKP